MAGGWKPIIGETYGRGGVAAGEEAGKSTAAESRSERSGDRRTCSGSRNRDSADTHACHRVGGGQPIRRIAKDFAYKRRDARTHGGGDGGGR